MKNKISLVVFFCLIIFSFSACVNQKKIAYFQKAPGQSDTIAVAGAYIPTIQPGDILAISIGSLNPTASSFFNPYSTTPVGEAPAEQTGSTTLSQANAPGFLVDANGMIELPIIGAVKLSGLTTVAAKDTLKRRARFYLKEPTVIVRLLNYKISVMGEVTRPSVYTIPNEKITLPEALSMAGDLTIYGKRENILVVRDVDGKKQFGRVDLTTRDVYASPYYYLRANDVVYVEPSKGRIAQTDKTYQILPLVLSALSFLTILVGYSRR